MRTTYKIAVLTALAISLSPAASAGKKLDSPRLLEPGLPIVATAPPGNVAAPLSASTPRALTMCSAWMTSDFEIDEFATNTLWCECEDMTVRGGFYTPLSKSVSATVSIKDSTGALIAKADGTLAPETAITPVRAEFGQFAAGFYKVITRIRQGDRTVSQSFWFQVTAATDPQCTHCPSTGQ